MSLSLKNYKVGTAVILSASLTALLYGCGNTNTASDSQQSSSTKGSKTIVVYAQDHPSIASLKPLIPEFEKETGIHVELNVYPYPDILNKEQVALASGSPDFSVGMADPLYLYQWNQAGWLTNLQDDINNQNITNKENLALSDFMPQMLNQLNTNGVQYGLPIYGETTDLFYNKDILAKNHLSVPKTLDELMADAKIANDPKNNQYGIVLRGQRGNGLNIYIWTGIYRSFGGKFFDNGRPDIDSPAGVKATTWYANILSKYGPPGPASIGWQEALDTFSQGKAAFMIDASTLAGPVEDPTKSKVAGHVGFSQIPSGPSGSFPSLSAWGMFIPKGAPNSDEAWKFIQWALSPQVQTKSAISGNRSDVSRTSIWKSADYTSLFKKWDNWSDVTLQNFMAASPDYRPRISNWTTIGDILGEQVSAAESGQISPEQAMKQAQTSIEKSK